MSLLCELGWHQGDRLAPWNNGYYFSKCKRCRRDIVRASTGGWFAPKGFRVVWQPTPPESRKDAAPPIERREPGTAALAASAAVAAAQALPPAPPEFPPATAAAPPPEHGDVATPAADPAEAGAAEAAATPSGDESALGTEEVTGTVSEVVAPPVALTPPPAPAAPMRSELPIQEVLRHLQNEPIAPEPSAPEPSAPEPSRAPAAEPPSAPAAAGDFDFDDFFMDDEVEEKSWQLAVPSPADAHPEDLAGTVHEATASGHTTRMSAEPATVAAVPAGPKRLRPRDEHAAGGERDTRPPPRRAHEVPLVIAGIVLLSVLGTAILSDFPSTRSGPGNATGAEQKTPAQAQPAASPPEADPRPTAAEVAPTVDDVPPAPAHRDESGAAAAAREISAPLREIATVSASVVNCRSNASEAAPTIRKMLRGVRVEVLARQAGWANVAYRQKQCWIADEYLDEK